MEVDTKWCYNVLNITDPGEQNEINRAEVEKAYSKTCLEIKSSLQHSPQVTETKISILDEAKNVLIVPGHIATNAWCYALLDVNQGIDDKGLEKARKKALFRDHPDRTHEPIFYRLVPVAYQTILKERNQGIDNGQNDIDDWERLHNEEVARKQKAEEDQMNYLRRRDEEDDQEWVTKEKEWREKEQKKEDAKKKEAEQQWLRQEEERQKLQQEEEERQKLRQEEEARQKARKEEEERQKLRQEEERQRIQHILEERARLKEERDKREILLRGVEERQTLREKERERSLQESKRERLQEEKRIQQERKEEEGLQQEKERRQQEKTEKQKKKKFQQQEPNKTPKQPPREGVKLEQPKNNPKDKAQGKTLRARKEGREKQQDKTKHTKHTKDKHQDFSWAPDSLGDSDSDSSPKPRKKLPRPRRTPIFENPRSDLRSTDTKTSLPPNIETAASSTQKRSKDDSSRQAKSTRQKETSSRSRTDATSKIYTTERHPGCFPSRHSSSEPFHPGTNTEPTGGQMQSQQELQDIDMIDEITFNASNVVAPSRKHASGFKRFKKHKSRSVRPLLGRIKKPALRYVKARRRHLDQELLALKMIGLSPRFKTEKLSNIDVAHAALASETQPLDYTGDVRRILQEQKKKKTMHQRIATQRMRWYKHRSIVLRLLLKRNAEEREERERSYGTNSYVNSVFQERVGFGFDVPQASGDSMEIDTSPDIEQRSSSIQREHRFERHRPDVDISPHIDGWIETSQPKSSLDGCSSTSKIDRLLSEIDSLSIRCTSVGCDRCRTTIDPHHLDRLRKAVAALGETNNVVNRHILTDIFQRLKNVIILWSETPQLAQVDHPDISSLLDMCEKFCGKPATFSSHAATGSGMFKPSVVENPVAVCTNRSSAQPRKRFIRKPETNKIAVQNARDNGTYKIDKTRRGQFQEKLNQNKRGKRSGWDGTGTQIVWADEIPNGKSVHTKLRARFFFPDGTEEETMTKTDLEKAIGSQLANKKIQERLDS